MKCTKCNKVRKRTDFYNYSDKCYKCVYQEKMKKEKKKPKKCKVCGVKLPASRWVYCSPHCYDLAMERKKNPHWSRRTSRVITWGFQRIKPRWMIERDLEENWKL